MNEKRAQLEKELADLKSHEAVADSPTRITLNQQIGEVQRKLRQLDYIDDRLPPMTTMPVDQSWSIGSTGNHQPIIVEEGTGRFIAQIYDAKDAPLIAAAPKLFQALEELFDLLPFEQTKTWIKARDAISLAKGE